MKLARQQKHAHNTRSAKSVSCSCYQLECVPSVQALTDDSQKVANHSQHEIAAAIAASREPVGVRCTWPRAGRAFAIATAP